MLQGLTHLINWNLDAKDGEIGKVEDFYFDDQTWAVRYLVVRTGGWLSGRKVLISPTVVIGNSWDLGLFPVSITKEQVRDSPDINTDKPVSRQHEAELAVYYSWQSTWGPGFYPGAAWGVITLVWQQGRGDHPRRHRHPGTARARGGVAVRALELVVARAPGAAAARRALAAAAPHHPGGRPRLAREATCAIRAVMCPISRRSAPRAASCKPR